MNESAKERYAYFYSLSLEEIREHLDELTESISGVRKSYTGPIGKHRKKIKDEDAKVLTDAFGDLLPMSLNPDVQQEILNSTAEHLEDSTHAKISQLTEDIALFLSRFENTGVTLITSGLQPPI